MRGLRGGSAAQGALYGAQGGVGRRKIGKRTFLAAILVAAALGALLGGVLRLAWPEAAFANTCYKDPLYNTETEDGSHRGIHSKQMTVEDYSTECVEVDSIAVVNSAGAMEIGTAHSAPGQNCNTQNPPQNPYMFEDWTTSSGAGWCVYGTPVTPWDKEGFAVEDQDGNYNWTFWHNESVVSTPFGTVNFNKGLVVTNAERHDSADSAWGHFEQNYYMPLNGSWTSLDSSIACGTGTGGNGAISNDPDFNNQIWSPSNITVSTGTSQNCND